MYQESNFTATLQAWVNTPDAQKNWDEGALLLLQLSGNKIMYHNISVNPKGKAEFIKGKLQQYLNFRLQKLTKVQVQEMQTEVDEIVKKVVKPAEESEFADFKAGKRADHDDLPDEIKALYAENLDIVHRMRELHLKLRTLSLDNATCPDSDRYPFLKEIITLDKRLHANWDTYDHFVIGITPVAEAPVAVTSPEVPESPEAEIAPKATEESAPTEEKPKKTAGRKPKANTKKATKK